MVDNFISDISISKILITLSMAFLIGFFIYILYKRVFSGMGGSDVLIDEPTQGTLAERPLVAKLLANETYLTKYHEIVRSMLNGYLKNETFLARINELDTLIASYVKADPSAFYTFEQYDSDIEAVKTFMSTMASTVKQQLDGTLPATGDGNGNGGGMGGDFGGQGTTPQLQGSTSEAVTTGIAIVLLLLAAAFVSFYKRKRL